MLLLNASRSESLKNLASLIQRGNTVEIRNYISLLTGVLKRLRQDPEANTHAQKHTRNVLICALCDFKGNDQVERDTDRRFTT